MAGGGGEKRARGRPNNVHLLANDGPMAALPDDDGSTARPCLWVCGRGDGGRLQGPRRGSAGALDLAGRKKLLCARLETYLRHTTQGPPGLRAHEFREGLRGVDVVEVSLQIL